MAKALYGHLGTQAAAGVAQVAALRARVADLEREVESLRAELLLHREQALSRSVDEEMALGIPAGIERSAALA